MTMRVNTSSFLADMRSALNQVSEATGEDALRTAGFAGAEVLRSEAKLNASRHVVTGTLMNNIIVKRVEEKSDGARLQTYYVMVRSGKIFREGDAFYWRWVENGHKFVPKNKKISKRTGKKIGWKAHREAAALEYGTASAPAYPFMRPAFDAKRGAAVEAMGAALSRVLSTGIGRT